MLHKKNCIFYNFTYFLAKRIAFVVLATIMVLTGVSLGIIYSLPPKTYTKPGKMEDLLKKFLCIEKYCSKSAEHSKKAHNFKYSFICFHFTVGLYLHKNIFVQKC